MPEDKIVTNTPETAKVLPLSPLSDEWIPLIEASKLLGLKSIRQVYRRIEKHTIEQRTIVTGTRVRSYVRRDDVLKSKKLALEEAQMSDVLSDMTDVTSLRRHDDVGRDVTRNVTHEVKEHILSISNKLDKIEDVRRLVTNFIDLAKKEMGERGEEREASIKAKEKERQFYGIKMICYVVMTLLFVGFISFTIWQMASGRMFK